MSPSAADDGSPARAAADAADFLLATRTQHEANRRTVGRPVARAADTPEQERLRAAAALLATRVQQEANQRAGRRPPVDRSPR